MLVGEITNADAKVRPIDDFKKCYGHNINILDYLRVKNLSIISSIN